MNNPEVVRRIQQMEADRAQTLATRDRVYEQALERAAAAEAAPPNPEVVRRSQEMEARRQQLVDTRDKIYQQAIGRRAGDCYGECGGNMANLDCAGLAREKAATEKAQADQQMAAESYKKDPSTRNPPPGYSNATDADLESLGLRDGDTGELMTQLPEHPDFNAAVFKNDATGDYVIGFKGTEIFSGDDWATNARQNFGGKTEYYSQAMDIAREASRRSNGGLSFVGHSLGGGQAAAAAGATGLPAVTFNAAGLHPNTVPDFNPNASIESWYTRGDILSLGQGLDPVQDANGRRILLKPPLSPWDVSPLGGTVTRHLNGRIEAALARRMEAIEELQKEKGCPQ